MAMELDNTFTVPVPPETAWDLLLDVAKIAPCMPGATIDEVDGDVVNGRIKVKVGPVSLTYKGTATFIERDETSHKVTLEASGKETRGAGTASATVTASLAPTADGATAVSMHTTMNVTGRPAQFGRGVMVEVGGKLVDTFAANLAQQLAAETGPAEAADGAADGGAAGTHPDTVDTPALSSDSAAPAAAPAAAAPAPAAPPAGQDSINLVRLVGPAILKRIVPVAAAGAALALLARRIRRAFRHRGGA